jgi:cytochrome bd ubiquinol oxidase subunit II
MDLPLIAGLVIAFGIVMYVLLDGFDLGVGILFPFAPTHQDRDVMINSIAPVWDGNETWLVLGGTTLFAAFPIAYSILFPAWYIPFMLFLFAIVFRGVAFEFRPKARRKWLWSLSFSAGSILATFA